MWYTDILYENIYIWHMKIDTRCKICQNMNRFRVKKTMFVLFRSSWVHFLSSILYASGCAEAKKLIDLFPLRGHASRYLSLKNPGYATGLYRG